MNKTIHTPLPAKVSFEADDDSPQGFDFNIYDAETDLKIGIASARNGVALIAALETRYNYHDRLVEALRTAHRILDDVICAGENDTPYTAEELQHEDFTEARKSLRALLAELEAK